MGPTSGAVPPALSPFGPPRALSGPRCPLSPCWAAHPALSIPSGPVRPPPGHHPPCSSSSTLPPSSLPHGRLDTHYSLSSTMSLRGSAAARCPPSLPPASRRPLSPWPGPAACAPSLLSALSPSLSLRSPRRLLPPLPRRLPRRCRRRPELQFRSAARGRGVSAATRASRAALRADLSAEAEPSRARPLPSLSGPRR